MVCGLLAPWGRRQAGDHALGKFLVYLCGDAGRSIGAGTSESVYGELIESLWGKKRPFEAFLANTEPQPDPYSVGRGYEYHSADHN